jgi:lipoprotein yaeC
VECSKERIHWHEDFVLCQLHDDADDAHVQHVHALSWRKWSFPFRNCLRKTAKRQRKVNDLPLFFTARTAYTSRGLSVPKSSYYKISKENKTMKKHSFKLTALVLALVLTAALALTGCGSKSDDSDGATTIQIAVPNDTTNEARALLLLQDNGIIKLADGAGITATKNDIVENPYNVEIVETEAAQIPNILQDVDYAVINSNYAINAGLNPVADSLVIEGSASAYANILAVKEGNESSPKVLALIAALESQQVVDYINEKYDGSVVSTVDTPTDGFDATVDYDALAGETISIAASPTPHAEILEVVKEILAEKNITLDIQVYNDYVVPNTVVEDGTVDANYFQHKPYLDDFNAENNTHIVSVAAIHVEPMGLYGGKQTTLDALSAK